MTGPKPNQPPLIALENVTVMRGAREGLSDITLRIAAGEHVCILGPNGCGKSTLIKTVTRELYPAVRENSSISIYGKSRWDVFELRTLLGIVSPDILSASTGETFGRDVVLSGFFSSTRIFEHHHIAPELLARAAAALRSLGVAHLAQRPLAQMSSGEVKRVLIARALVHEPKALLFDEPSNSLDIGAQRQLRETMQQLARRGIAILLVTHDIADIIPEINRLVLLRRGKIAADGPKEKLLTSERLSELFDAPVKIVRQDGHYYLL